MVLLQQQPVATTPTRHSQRETSNWSEANREAYIATGCRVSRLLRRICVAERYLSPEGPKLEVSRSVRAVRVQDDRWILSGHSGAEQGRQGQGAMSLRVIPFLTYM